MPTIEVNAYAPTSKIGKSYLDQTAIDLRQADNIGQLLDGLPGIQMIGTPRPNGQALNIWGLGDQEDVQINVDGANKNFERYQQGTVFVEPELLKRVVVDKGHFDVRRANGGFGGAVHLETKDASDWLKPEQNIGGLAKYSYHHNGRLRHYNAAIFMRNQWWDGLAYVSLRKGRDLSMPTGEDFRFSSANDRNILLKNNFYLGEDSKLTLSFINGEHRGWEPWAAKSGNALTPPTIYDINRYGLEEAWKRRLVYRKQKDKSLVLDYRYTPNMAGENQWLDLRATYSYSKTQQDDKRSQYASNLLIASGGNQSSSAYTDHKFEISNTSRFTTGKIQHRLLIGTALTHHNRDAIMYVKGYQTRADYNYGWYIPYYMPSGTQRIASIYLQDDIQIGKLTLSPAIRYDYVRNKGKPNPAPIYNDFSAGHDYRSVSYTGWSPYLNIQYQVTPQFNLFAGVSRSWRAPVIDEQYTVQSNRSTRSATSRDLKAETMTQYRTGFVWHKRHLWQKQDQLNLRATYFMLRGRDEIFSNRGVFCEQEHQTGNKNSCGSLNAIGNYRNLPGYDIKGIEIEAYYDSPNWFASLSGNYSKGYRLASPRDPWFEQRTWLTSTPPAKATATLGYKFNHDKLLLGWRSEFVKRADRSVVDTDPKATSWALPKTKGYALHGIFASWQVNDDFNMQLTIDNLFNREYYPYLSEKISGLGRNVKFSLSYRF